MRLVIALGGNALLKRGEPMLCENQRENVSLACRQIAKAYAGNELVVTHGNGPQVGLLALQNNAYKKVPMYPLDVIGAESVGMIGYMIQQELVNYVPKTATLATILTQTQVDPDDPAFQHPTKPVAPSTKKKRPNSSPNSTAGPLLPITTSGAASCRVRILSAFGALHRSRHWWKTVISSFAAAEAAFRPTLTRMVGSLVLKQSLTRTWQVLCLRHHLMQIFS